MADAVDLLSLDEAKSALNIGRTDVDKDVELERSITSASVLIDRHFGASVKRSVTLQCQEHYTRKLQLEVWPASSIESVTVDDVTLDPDTYRIVDGAMSILLCSLTYRALTHETITVVYTAGRVDDTAAVDAHTKHGAVMQVMHMFRPFQAGSAEVSEYDVTAIATVTAGLARGLRDHFELEDIGIA